MAPFDWLKNQASAPRTQALYDQALVSGVNFITLVYLGRHFESDMFGYFMLAYMSVIGFAMLHTALVVQPFNLIGATRPAAANFGHFRALVRVHLWVLLPLGVASILLFGWKFFPDARLCTAASVYLCAFLLQELLRRYWYTCGEIKHALVNDLISYGAQLPLIFWIGSDARFDGAAAFYVMAATSCLALLHGWFRLHGKPSLYMSARELFDLHWVTGAWLLLAAVSAYGVTQLYPYMLAGLGAGAVAAFAAARNVLNALNVFVQAANNYLPIKSKRTLELEGAEQMRLQLRRAGIAMGVVAGAFCLVAALLSPDLMVWIYGKSFAGDRVLPLMAVGAFVASMFPIVNAGILALHVTPVIFFSNVIATLFNLSVGWWLISRYGVDGAAMAASLSLALVLVIQVWRLRDALAQSIGPKIEKPCLPQCLP